MTPVRIQRKRTKGWKMPDNTVYVGRPTKWGNIFAPDQYWDAGYSGNLRDALYHCVKAYESWFLGKTHWAHTVLPELPDITPLKGKNLACWCAIDQPCHADVLLELANRGDK